MRRYEFVEGSSKKFWEIELEDDTFTTRWGRIGSAGQEKTVAFDSPAEAREAHDKLITEKEKKGYRLVGGTEAGARPLTQQVPRNPALEAAIRANPSDAHGWQVFADWLEEQGEPWGEVIGAAARGKPDEQRQREALAALVADAEGFEATWAQGAFATIAFAPQEVDPYNPMGAVLERVLRHPAGHFVRELSLGLPPHDDLEWHMEPLVAAMAKAGPLPFLEVLDLSEPSEHMDQESWRRVGDVRGLWAACPNLRVLKLRGSAGSDEGPKIKLAPIDAPALETLVIFSGGLDVAAPLELGKAWLPKLTHLELLFGREDFGCTSSIASLAGILSGAGLPKLAFLGLKNSEWEAELIEAIARSAILPRLEVLDLSMGVMWRDGAAAIVEHAAAFEHLEKLILDDNFFSDEQLEAITGALANVEVGEQKHFDEDDGDEDPWRYTTIGE